MLLILAATCRDNLRRIRCLDFWDGNITQDWERIKQFTVILRRRGSAAVYEPLCIPPVRNAHRSNVFVQTARKGRDRCDRCGGISKLWHAFRRPNLLGNVSRPPKSRPSPRTGASGTIRLACDVEREEQERLSKYKCHRESEAGDATYPQRARLRMVNL